MFKNGKKLTVFMSFSHTRSFWFSVILLVIQTVDVGAATSLLNSDELKTLNRFYHPPHDYINYFANILDAKKQPTADQSIFFHIISDYNSGIASLNARYSVFVLL